MDMLFNGYSQHASLTNNNISGIKTIGDLAAGNSTVVTVQFSAPRTNADYTIQLTQQCDSAVYSLVYYGVKNRTVNGFDITLVNNRTSAASGLKIAWFLHEN